MEQKGILPADSLWFCFSGEHWPIEDHTKWIIYNVTFSFNTDIFPDGRQQII